MEFSVSRLVRPSAVAKERPSWLGFPYTTCEQVLTEKSAQVMPCGDFARLAALLGKSQVELLPIIVEMLAAELGNRPNPRRSVDENAELSMIDRSRRPTMFPVSIPRNNNRACLTEISGVFPSII